MAQQVLQERAFLEAEPEAAAALARLLRLKRLEQRLRKASTAGSAAAPPPPRGKPGKSPRRTWAHSRSKFAAISLVSFSTATHVHTRRSGIKVAVLCLSGLSAAWASSQSTSCLLAHS